jgi:hypothetical protein
MKYYVISQGFQGCYMPDNCYIVAVNTRRELKSVLESEAYYIRDSGAIGCNKKQVAWLAAECWRNRDKCTLDFVAAYRYKYQTGYPLGLLCSPSNRIDFLEWKKYENY